MAENKSKEFMEDPEDLYSNFIGYATPAAGGEETILEGNTIEEILKRFRDWNADRPADNQFETCRIGKGVLSPYDKTTRKFEVASGKDITHRDIPEALDILMLPGLSAKDKAERLISAMEANGIGFTDFRDMLINYADKRDDIEGTAEAIFYIKEKFEIRDDEGAYDRVLELQELVDYMPSEIGLSEMHEYGYRNEEMFPLDKETALDLAVLMSDKVTRLYCLYPDGTEAAVQTREQIMNHDGLLGIKQEDWEDAKEYFKECFPYENLKTELENVKKEFVKKELENVKERKGQPRQEKPSVLKKLSAFQSKIKESIGDKKQQKSIGATKQEYHR